MLQSLTVKFWTGNLFQSVFRSLAFRDGSESVWMDKSGTSANGRPGPLLNQWLRGFLSRYMTPEVMVIIAE